MLYRPSAQKGQGVPVAVYVSATGGREGTAGHQQSKLLSLLHKMISLASSAAHGFLQPLPTGGVGTTDPKPWTSEEIGSVAGLKDLAFKLNPAVGYWCDENHRI